MVRGGLIVYATELKHELAGVDQQLLDEHGAVHPEVAIQLAEGARTRCGSDWGIGLTGVAGPDPQDGVAPGTVHIGLSGPGVSTVRTITVSGDRHEPVAFSTARARKRWSCSSEYLLMTVRREQIDDSAFVRPWRTCSEVTARCRCRSVT